MWKRKEKGRRKNIKAKLIVDVDEEVLALFNFVTKVGKKNNRRIRGHSGQEVLKSSCGIYQAVPVFG